MDASNQPTKTPKPRRRSFGGIKALLTFLKSATFRDAVFAGGLLLVEAILSVRYGTDTYFRAAAEHAINLPNAAQWMITALSLLDVTLIDGVFVLMLVVAKNAGTSNKASNLRTFAVVAASIMFVVMIGVATSTIQVVIAARWAGGLLLGYIGSDVLLDLLRKVGQAIKAKRNNNNTWRQGLRNMLGALAYIVGALVAIPAVVLLSIARAARDYYQDFASATTSTSKIVTGQARALAASKPALPASKETKIVINKDQRTDTLLVAWRDNPLINNRELGDLLGTSPQAVQQRKAKLVRAGIIRVEGDRTIVID